VGRLPGSQRLNLAITLQLRNQAELQSLLRDLYDPASPNYRHFLTVEEFTERFGPTTDDHERVAAFARSNGLAVTHTAANRLVLDVSGAVSDIERAFGVTMHVYQHPTEKRIFYAPDVEPSLDPSIPLQGLQGLNNLSPPRPADLKFLPLEEGTPQSLTGSGPSGYFLGSDFRAAYAPGVTLDGSGQAVGLYEESGYNLSDVQLTFSSVDQPLKPPIVNVLLDGLTGLCLPVCDDTEPVLDIAAAISMAPNLSAVIVYEGSSDVDILNQMATDNIAKQLSVSWVWGPDPTSVEPIFEEFAAQGQNLFASSGDAGAYSPPSCVNNCQFAYPASDPYVTAVGGTDLTTTGPGGPWQSETAWVDSGGGITNFPIPSYQIPLINPSNQGSTTLRNVPDVAANANTDSYICSNGTCGSTGGTSLATPIWAGFLALVNEQANGTPIGFLNPTIYALAQGSNYANDFHDITSGNNYDSFSPGLFSAVTGYDLVTGLGSPNGQSLLNALGPATTGPNFKLASSPSTISLTPGNQGTSVITINAVNGFSGAVSLKAAVVGQSPGVTVSMNPTTVTGSGTSTLTVSTVDSPLTPSMPIVVTGTSGGLTQTVYITLAVLMPDLVETAVSGPPALLNAGSSFSVTDTTANTGQAEAGTSVTGYYLSATTTKTVNSHLLGSRAVPSLAINAVSSGTVSVTVPSGLWPNTAYYLLACANDTGTVVEASASPCIASTATTTLNAPAPPATATSLAITSGGNGATTVAQGSTITLTATVTSGGAPVSTGQVNFCDATARLCTDIHLLGTAQLLSTGAAALKFVPGPGTHSYKAVFRGTINIAGSSSTPSALTVGGTSPTNTNIVAQSGGPGDYTLTAQVTGPGPAAPTGEVSFLDTSNGNSVLGMAALTGGAPGLNWTNPQTATTDLGPFSVAVGDFNGDGIPDLAIANGEYRSLTILLGKGDGTFSAGTSVTFPYPWQPNSVAVGDFNGDGKLDLALSMISSSTAQGEVAILLGGGDGTFTMAPVSPAIASYPEFVAVGDFNGDGKADLAILNYNPNICPDSPGTLTVLLGNGDGTFTAAASIMTRNAPSSIAVGDFNGDGKQDIAVSNGEDGALTILLGNGDGTFTEAPSPLSGLCSWSVVTADFNGDGKADLALANSSANTVMILLGNGDGTFTPATTSLPTGNFPADIAVGDFNGDGMPDLAAVNVYSNTVTILLGNGDGTFTPASVSPATGNYPQSVAAADFSGNGKTDLATANMFDNTATILLSEPTVTGTATASGISPLGLGTHLVDASYPGDSNYNSSLSGTTVSLSGGAPVVGLSASSISFGNQAVGTTSAASGVTVNNTGTAALTFTNIAVTGDFAISASSTTCSTSAPVTAGGSCVINVTFTPTATASRSGSLTLTDNASGSPQSVSLSGTGTGPVVSLSAPLTFSAQLVGSTSSSQTVTLTNTGNGSLTFTAIAVSSTFAIATSGTTCSTSTPVAAAGTCTVAVTFTPTTAGAASGSLSFSDNAPGSPQTIALTGTGQDFSIGPSSGSPTSVTITPGQPGSYTLSVGGEDGLSGTVSFTCAGAPSEATCTVSPNPVTVGSSATNVTVTVTTTAPSVSAPRSRPLPPAPPLSPCLKGLLMLALVLAAMACVVMRRNQLGVNRWQSTMVPLILGILLILTLAGCGGGGGSGGGGGTTPNPGTPAGTYTLTVTATTGSGSSVLNHTMTLTLTVS
jgi:hypothetical protein